MAAAIFRVWQSFQIEAPKAGFCLSKTTEGIGKIVNEPERKETGQVFVVLAESLAPVVEIKDSSSATGSATGVEGCPANFLIRLKTKLYPEFFYGQEVAFRGHLLAPVNFGNKGERQFDYRGYLAKDDVFYEMKSAVVDLVDDRSDQSNLFLPDSATAVPAEHFFGFLHSSLYNLKGKFVHNLGATLGEPHAALASGLVVGEKASLGNDLLADFRTVGLIHIVVLSGYNITIVADAMRRLLIFLPRVWGISIGGLGIMLFGILVGGGATVVRSCVMAGIALSADLIRRDYNVVRALTLAALVMLIQNPMILLHDPSFQLSFLATLGLILLAGPIERRLGFLSERFGLRGIVASTIATQIFVSPYILYMMGQISIIGMVVNILVLPAIPLTMLFVFLEGASGFVWFPLSQFFGFGSHLLLSYELMMVGIFARLPFAAAHLPPFSVWWVVGFYFVFGTIFIYLKRQTCRKQSAN